MKRIITTLIIAAALAGPLLAVPGSASADVGVGISVNFGPPLLPYYPQPICPGIGFIWTPGYWAYSNDGYFWVPGTWVLAPAVGLLWTPGWWGWDAGRYWWHAGYWGRHVGFYGGIHYGYGYSGIGYHGGYWRGGAFYYNRAVSNVNITIIHNTYNQAISNTPAQNRVSYNGGSGGIVQQPTTQQQTFSREQHFTVTEAQMEQQRAAGNNPAQRYAVNHGRPQIAATVRPGEFTGQGVVKLEQKRAVKLERPVAHATPGQPSFQKAVRTEREPVIRAGQPRVETRQSARPAPAMPVQREYRNQPRMRTEPSPAPVRMTRPVRSEAPRAQQPVRDMPAPHARAKQVRPEPEPRHKDKVRPPH
ncbi:MAG TPA: hypothetical protein VFX47_04640 [Gammaproteobacteria bacterium]|nr:hypothetical protein [Gammaproteobacteria bacterium]